MIIVGIIVALYILMIVVGGNRYRQAQQTKAIIRAIQGPKRVPLSQGGWKDPLLWKFLFVTALLILFVIIGAVAGNHGS